MPEKMIFHEDEHFSDNTLQGGSILQEPPDLKIQNGKFDGVDWLGAYPVKITSTSQIYKKTKNATIVFGFRFSHENIYIYAQEKN